MFHEIQSVWTTTIQCKSKQMSVSESTNFLCVLSLNTLTVQSCRILNFSLVYLSLCTDACSPKGNMRGIRALSQIIMFLFDKLSSNKTISVLQYLIWRMEPAKESNLCMWSLHEIVNDLLLFTYKAIDPLYDNFVIIICCLAPLTSLLNFKILNK